MYYAADKIQRNMPVNTVCTLSFMSSLMKLITYAIQLLILIYIWPHNDEQHDKKIIHF